MSQAAPATSARYLNKEAAAAYLNVSPRQIDLWVSAGTIPCIRLGRRLHRYDVQALDAFMHRHTVR